MITARAYLLSSLLLLAGIAPALLSGSARHISSSAFGAPGADFNAKSVRVYVSVFDINAAPPPAKEPARIPPPPAPQRSQDSTRPSTESPRVLSDAEANSKQAAQLQAFFGDALLQALRKSGFTAAPQAGSRPEKGALLKGVFAEVDSQNHNCLAILGGHGAGTAICAVCWSVQSGAARSAPVPGHDHGELRCALRAAHQPEQLHSHGEIRGQQKSVRG